MIDFYEIPDLSHDISISIEDLISSIKEKYSYLTEDLGINLDELYACGSFGCAFATEDENFTAKFTIDNEEIEYYKFAQKYNDILDFLPKIKLIGNLTPLWYLVLRESVTEDLRGLISRNTLEKFEKHILTESAEFLEEDQTILDISAKNIGKSSVDGRYILFDGELYTYDK